MRRARHILAAALLLALARPAASAEPYRLRQEVVVPGPAAAFDYVAYHEGRLFAGHRPAGLDVFHVGAGFALTKVAQTAGSNGATLMPDLGIGVSNNQGGTLTVFLLSDLSVREVVRVGDELDNSRYDPVTRRLAVFGTRAAGGGSAVAVFQAPGMERVGTIAVESEKLENPAADGDGGIWVSAQDSDEVLHLDLRSLRVTATLPTPGCKEPTGLAFDRADRRLMVGCRGEYRDPSFLVMGADDGRVYFRGPLGPGNDGVVYDPVRRVAFAANGVGANLAVFERIGQDEYRLAQVLGTRPMAKTLAYDQASGTLYSITAEPSYDPSRRNSSTIAPFYPNGFFPDTFRILVFGQ